MALFRVSIRRYSIVPRMFPFRSHFQDSAWEISPICHLKYSYSCFSSYFCFLVIFVLFMFMLSVLLLVSVICVSLFFLTRFSNPPVDALKLHSMLSYYYNFSNCKLFTPALIDGFLQESVWQQFPFSLQDSFQYFGWSLLLLLLLFDRQIFFFFGFLLFITRSFPKT